MVDALAAAAEEHQVAGVQCVTFDLLAAVRHLPRDARQFDAQGTAEYIADQPAAVEAVGGAAAPAVWRAEQGQRALEQGPDAAVGIDGRSDERRVGQACGSRCRYRWSP